MENELKLSDFADCSTVSPVGVDLWPRIAAAHRARVRRRRVVRFGVAVSTILVVAVVSISAWQATRPSPTIDWQARAQALELQLSAMSASASNEHAVSETEADLARIDRSLQAAYDRGADANELAPLWKQRSELLSVLLTARRQSVALTRI